MIPLAIKGGEKSKEVVLSGVMHGKYYGECEAKKGTACEDLS